MEQPARQIIEAVEDGKSLVLADPAWPDAWKDKMKQLASGLEDLAAAPILVPTSGSTGLPKYCIHTSTTLQCATRGYVRRFGEQGIIHSVNILPLHHVGGFMPILRSRACSGRVHFSDYRNSASIQSAPFPLEQASISVVPTQLRRMMADEQMVAMLRRFALILVGGAACPGGLLDAARLASLNLSPCYGSTETAAMVSALDPEDFLAGAEGVGTPLPHADIEVDAERRIRIIAESVTLGYLPETAGFSRQPFLSGDLGQIDKNGHLHILGRADRVIITGGEKVHPEQVESAALSSGLVLQARCSGIPDPEWGQMIRLEVVLNPESNQAMDRLRSYLSDHLPAYAVPKLIM